MPKTSESIKEIVGALINFNKKFKGINADAANPFFKNNYISFDSIVGLRNKLAEEGLVMFQSVGTTEDGGASSIVTTLAHSSGEWIQSDALVLKPVKSDPQGVGSAISYGKRYQLAAMLGIAEVVDDDGNQASGTTNTPAANQIYNQSTDGANKQNKAPAAQQTPTGMTEEQATRMTAAIKGKGLTRDQAISICKKTTGKESASQLTSAEAEKVILAYQNFNG